MKHYHFGTFCIEICQNDTVLAKKKEICNKFKSSEMILFQHQKMETIVMKNYCFGTFCIEICQNNTVSAQKRKLATNINLPK